MISSYSPTNVSNEKKDFNPSLVELIEEIPKTMRAYLRVLSVYIPQPN